MSISVSSNVVISPGDGGAVLFHKTTGRYYQINDMGLQILQAIERGATTEQTVAAIAAGTNTPTARVSADAAQFVSSMQERGILE